MGSGFSHHHTGADPYINDFCGEPIPGLGNHAGANLAHAKPTSVNSSHHSAAYGGHYWDVPVSGNQDVVYVDKLSQNPLFSSKDQIIKTNECVGMLQFKKSIGHIVRNPAGEILVPQKQWVGSDLGSDSCAIVGHKHSDSVSVGARDTPENTFFSHSTTKGAYALAGPHYLGFRAKDGTLCVDPASVNPINTKIFVDNGTNGPIIQVTPRRA